MDFIFDPSLVVYVPLHQLDGASFMSRDAYGCLCTVTGASWRPNGRYFDGTDDKVSVPACAPLDITSQVTVIAWANHNANANEFIAAKWTGDQAYGILESGTGKLVGFVTISNIRKEAMSTGTIAAGKWHHFAVTYNGAKVQSYINAGQDGTINATGSIDTTTDPFTIGWGISNTYGLVWQDR